MTTLMASEIVGGDKGIGMMIQQANGYYQMDVMLMGIILLGIIGICFEKIVKFLERRVYGMAGNHSAVKVHIDHVVKKFNGRNGEMVALNGVDMDIHENEFICVVGPSGCGKSTTLRMIAGLEEITDGDTYIGERRVNDVAPKDRNIAMVFQSTRCIRI